MIRLISSITIVAALLVLTACDRRIYTRDGVTDGDTFYLAEYAYYDPDPVLQSWVAYSLDLSHCQLRIGGPNPARNHSYQCEFGARQSLIDRYAELRDDASGDDTYLTELTRTATAGFLDEYVALYFARRDWELPDDLDLTEFKRWRRQHLRGHKLERRIIGSWNFRDQDSDETPQAVR